MYPWAILKWASRWVGAWPELWTEVGIDFFSALGRRFWYWDWITKWVALFCCVLSLLSSIW